MATRIPFIKTYATPHELVQLLKTRGMEITDEEKALHYLSHIGYYRLSAYMYPLLSIPKEQHLFKQGVTFGKVMFRAYNTDNQLIIDTIIQCKIYFLFNLATLYSLRIIAMLAIILIYTRYYSKKVQTLLLK